MRAKDLNGKDILDSMGDKVGEVDDIEIDPMTKSVTAILAKEGSLSSKLGMGEKRTIPVDMIEAIGDNVLLKRATKGM
ncbi:PRC-barrel domain-containing protein [Methanobacterium sp. ACI-7]|uniref:PRC-barrel domain-containing protein n=1 Tax=unclassified Methanobacterium TaxID=2627676 RepID=UPI0039C298FD